MVIALDFGTCNSVMARTNEADNRIDIIHMDELSRRYSFSLPAAGSQMTASVIPSLIHYGRDNHTLLGAKVIEEGELNHPSTFRWVKLDILRRNKRSRRVNGRRISMDEAAGELLSNILMFGVGGLETGERELVLTVPVEAFDYYVDWIQDVAGKVFSGDIRVIDEATACMLGYQQGVRDGNIYVIVDFGGGTLDISIVKVDFRAEGAQKCVVLGRAGEEVGGMLVDQWMLEVLIRDQDLLDEDMENVGIPLLTAVEECKIKISAGEEEADITQFNDQTNTLISHTFSRTELMGLLKKKELYRLISKTIDRAMNIAESKFNVKKRDIRSAFMVGGTSLLLGVGDHIQGFFPDIPVHCDKPFEAIAAGACHYVGDGMPMPLVHDYCLKSWNRGAKEYEYVPVIPKGTAYPTERPVCTKYISSGVDLADTLGLVIWEKSEMIMPDSTVRLRPDGSVCISEQGGRKTDAIRALNPEAGEFIHADPPCETGEGKRFIAGFGMDEHKRLTLSLKDTKEGNLSYVMTKTGKKLMLPLRGFPLVKL